MAENETSPEISEQAKKFQYKNLRALRDVAENTALSELERDNKELRDQAKEQQFALFFVVVMFINVLLFEKFQSSMTIVLVFAVFELLFFVVLAPRFGIQEIGTLVQNFLNAYSKKNGDDTK